MKSNNERELCSALAAVNPYLVSQPTSLASCSGELPSAPPWPRGLCLGLPNNEVRCCRGRLWDEDGLLQVESAPGFCERGNCGVAFGTMLMTNGLPIYDAAPPAWVTTIKTIAVDPQQAR